MAAKHRAQLSCSGILRVYREPSHVRASVPVSSSIRVAG